MINESIDQPQSVSSREARTNLFAMATIYSDTGSMPVKIRNLSSRGARAEGQMLLKAGARIRLCRGLLQVFAEVVWCRDGSVGLRFEDAITVTDWLPRGRAIAPQQRIDEIVHQARASGNVAPPPAANYVAVADVMYMDLLRLKQSIESLADALADDPAVVERYGSKLQILDVVGQTLRKIAIQNG